ncbi:MAG: molybdate ABC transporter substrate-binding protein [Oscillospiraceae bacterium]|nr:molybdate ABC transporter substrate-binding protein [Oscillospiraceae bacterium]
MKKILALLLALCMMLALAACGGTEAPKTEEPETAAEPETPAESETPAEPEVEEEPEPEAPAEPIELVVFAAASMTETLNELKVVYEASHPGVTILYNFDSSGTLKTQIEEGATCDLFISAGQKQMNQLDINASPEVNTDGLDFVQEGTRVNLLENKVVLVVPANNPKGIESFDQLAELLEKGEVLMAMGGADVPVGQYTQKILAWYGLDEAALSAAGCISYGGNVKQVTTQVEEGSVDCGVVYCTDAYSAGLTVVDSATAEMCGQVIYPAAVMKNAPHPAEALEFLNFLLSEEAMAVFETVGFSPVA